MPRRGRLSCLSAAAQAWTRPLERAVPALGDGDGWLVAFEARPEGNRPRIHLRSVASDGTATGSVTQVVEEDGVFESDRAALARDRNTDDVLLVYARTQDTTQTGGRSHIAQNVVGRLVRTVHGRRVTAPVRLTGLPRARFTVRIVARTADGRTFRGVRRHRTCVPRRPGGIPLL